MAACDACSIRLAFARGLEETGYSPHCLGLPHIDVEILRRQRPKERMRTSLISMFRSQKLTRRLEISLQFNLLDWTGWGSVCHSSMSVEKAPSDYEGVDDSITMLK